MKDTAFSTTEDGHVTFGAVVTKEGFIPQILIKTQAGHEVRFLADVVIVSNTSCAEFCRAICYILSNPTNEPMETLGEFE